MYTYEIRPADRLVILNFSDPASASACRDMMRRLWHDPQFSPLYNLLGDERTLETPFTAEDTHALTSFSIDNPERFHFRKMAICVSTETDFGMARMFGLLTDSHVAFETRVFRDWQEALDWVTG